MAMRWGDDIIVIDAGLMFPEAELLGVDIVVPDLSYLIANRARVRGVILTHGHMDHIGAVPWLLSELNVPVFATEFTLAYVEDKLEEHGLLDDAVLNEIRPGESFRLGVFTINPIQVTHSLVDCVALAIHTPLGVVIHTGDFKVDPTPTDNRLFDLHSFAAYGKQGVLALLQDSTNVERPGYTPSELAVRPRFEQIFAPPSAVSSSPVFPRRFIASSWRWSWPSAITGRLRCSGVRWSNRPKSRRTSATSPSPRAC